MLRKNNIYGFTIVEITVVVAVVGILAALAIIGVQGAAVQARNSFTGSAIARYKAALEKYARDNGDYPLSGSACLGEGYPDYDGDGSAGDCWHIGAPNKESAAFNAAIKPYMNNELPQPNSKPITGGGFNMVGAVFNSEEEITIDGQPHRWLISYIMEGDRTKCPIGPPLSSALWPTFTTTPTTNGYTHRLGDNGTGCYVKLPSPDQL